MSCPFIYSICSSFTSRYPYFFPICWQCHRNLVRKILNVIIQSIFYSQRSNTRVRDVSFLYSEHKPNKTKLYKWKVTNQTRTVTVLHGHVTYVSSGVSWTGSSVNWGSKLSRSSSDSRGGRKGGRVCFWFSCKKETHTERIGAAWRERK